MLNIKKLFEPSIGDKVTIKSNTSGHSYQIGTEYVVVNEGNGNYLLSPIQSVKTEVQDIGFQDHPFAHHHHHQSWISINDLDIKINKSLLIDELSDMLEFLGDYEGDISNSSKLEKEYKVYHILKEVKSEKSDFEKISIISKYI